MTMRREKSDGLVVPKSHRKVDEPGNRIGKGPTVNEETRQLDLLGGKAASLEPRAGSRVDTEGAGRSRSSGLPVPLSTSAESEVLSATTMEAIANDMNLRRAFERVASNDGAPGADRQSVSEVARHFDRVLSGLHETLLDGTCQPGLVRRVWIPKGGGGQRAVARDGVQPAGDEEDRRGRTTP